MSTPARHLAARIVPLSLVAVVALWACTDGDQIDHGSGTDAAVTGDQADPNDDGAGAGAVGEGEASPPSADAVCEGLGARTVAPVASAGLTEASGLAASGRHADTVWAHNDSGHEVVLYGLGLDGTVRAEVPVPINGTDIEDIAVAEGWVYLADIGDNDRIRDEVAVHRLPEPDLTSTPAAGVETIRLRYPDGPRDAEALLVDPHDGTLVIIEKEFQIATGEGRGLLEPTPAGLYTATPPFPTDQPVELTRAGTVALDELNLMAVAEGPTEGLVAALGVDGVATAADVSADGRVVAVRTYATVWLFSRAGGQSLVDALAGPACEAPTLLEQQGEAVAFVDPAGTRFVTLAEGSDPLLNLTARTG